MKLGVQLFGAMDIFRRDPEGFFEALAKAGYTEVEPCVAFGTTAEELAVRGVKPVWLPEEFAGLQKLAAEKGLEIRSCHVFGDPIEHREGLIKLGREAGLQAFVLNCNPKNTDEAFEALVATCKTTAEFLKEAGIELWLHNSYGEIEAKRNGVTLYQAVLEACEGKVGAQIDVGWVQYGGENPVALMDAIAPCLRSVHYKDIVGDSREVAPKDHPIQLGKGKLDTAGVKAKADVMEVGQLIDQDASAGDLLEDLVESARYLLSL